MHLILVCIDRLKRSLLIKSFFLCVTVLRQRQRYGLIDKSTIILTVDDPQDKIGSGGATLNALLVATQFLSAKAGYSVG